MRQSRHDPAHLHAETRRQTVIGYQRTFETIDKLGAAAAAYARVDPEVEAEISWLELGVVEAGEQRQVDGVRVGLQRVSMFTGLQEPEQRHERVAQRAPLWRRLTDPSLPAEDARLVRALIVRQRGDRELDEPGDLGSAGLRRTGRRHAREDVMCAHARTSGCLGLRDPP